MHVRTTRYKCVEKQLKWRKMVEHVSIFQTLSDTEKISKISIFQKFIQFPGTI